MISEIINSLFLTYLASEYLIAEEPPGQQRNNANSRFKHILQKRTIPLATIVLIINILENYLTPIIGVTSSLKSIFERFLHLPKAIFAAIAYVCGLYVDLRYNHHITIQIYPTFLRKVSIAFCKV